MHYNFVLAKLATSSIRVKQYNRDKNALPCVAVRLYEQSKPNALDRFVIEATPISLTTCKSSILSVGIKLQKSIRDRQKKNRYCQR